MVLVCAKSCLRQLQELVESILGRLFLVAVERFVMVAELMDPEKVDCASKDCGRPASFK